MNKEQQQTEVVVGTWIDPNGEKILVVQILNCPYYQESSLIGKYPFYLWRNIN